MLNHSIMGVWPPRETTQLFSLFHHLSQCFIMFTFLLSREICTNTILAWSNTEPKLLWTSTSRFPRSGCWGVTTGAPSRQPKRACNPKIGVYITVYIYSHRPQIDVLSEVLFSDSMSGGCVLKWAHIMHDQRSSLLHQSHDVP